MFWKKSAPFSNVKRLSSLCSLVGPTLAASVWLLAGCTSALTATTSPTLFVTTAATVSPTAPAATTPTATRPAPTTAPPAATSSNTNLALNRPVASSSEENAQNTMDNAVDGKTNTRWSSKYSDPQWLTVDLGATYAIRHITLRWEASGLSYQLQVSNDAVAWTDIYSTTTGAHNGGYKVTDEVDVNASGRYVRLYGTLRSSTWGYSLYEFEVFEDWTSPTTPTPAVTPTLETPTITPPPGWTLVWHDEFNGSEIDRSNWTYDLGSGANHWAFYTDRPENSFLQGGNLVIETRREANGETCLNGPCQYTSAQLRTSGLRSWQYGRIEARIKVPEGWGIWPAFWIMGDTGNWPACGEVDIMEMIGGAASGRQDTDYGTMHWDDAGHQSRGGVEQLPNQKFADAYHVFALEWDRNEFRWYLDNSPTPFYTARNNESGMEEFHQPFFLLLNVAVGGGWAGAPNADTVFPQRMLVDWVRVYQKPELSFTPTPTPTGWYSRQDYSAVYDLGASYTGTVVTEFDVTPLAEGFTGFIGYDTREANIDNLDLPVMIRLYLLGYFQVRRGAEYSALQEVRFQLYQTYHVKVVMRLDTQTMDVWVTPPAGEPIQIAGAYVFNTNAPPLTAVGQILVRSDKGDQFRVTNHTVTTLP